MKIRITAFALLSVLAMMLVCPALPAMAQEARSGHCEEQEKNQSDQTMICCDQQAVSVNLFTVPPAVDIGGILTEVRLTTDLTPDLKLRHRYWKTSDHLASLSVLRI